MSDYYVGPSGRMLRANGHSPDQEAEHPANPIGYGNHAYHLPPPRGSGALQFGTDLFVRQENAARRCNSWVNVERQQAGQLLPSVSQLLTNAQYSPPRRPSALGAPAARRTSKRRAHSFHHGHSTSPATVYDCPSSQAEGVPPISSVTNNSGLQPSPRQAPGSHPVLPAQHGMFPAMKGVEEISPPETPAEIHAQPPPVRPAVVDEKHIEGEGLCYIYADGSYCPKNIDGVPVNANWGVTKAGKPRKRLAQACLTCREKKIKCHPNLPKCDQCQKSGRDCRFENAPRGNRAALKTSISSRHDSDNASPGRRPSLPYTSPYSVGPASDSSSSLHGTGGQSPGSDNSMRLPSIVDSAQEMTDPNQSYRIKTKWLNIASASADNASQSMADAGPSLVPKYAEILADVQGISSESSLVPVWDMDPYSLDPDITMHYIECYFTNVNDSLYYIFPRKRFLLWLQSSRKSLDDKMLLYSMLTMGSIFSDRPDRLAAMRRYSRMAQYAVERSQHSLSLQLAQSRIILSLWYYAIGALTKAWDSTGAAAEMVCGLRYNMESGGVIVDQNQACEYGLHPQALMECRRRTFWVAYFMDRLSSFYSQASTFISSQAAFLRLPCQEEVFEAQEYATVPYFQYFLKKVSRSDDDLSAASPMAFWIEIASLWGEVVNQVLRLPHVPTESYSTLFGEFYATVVRRLEEWTLKLPSELAFTTENLERSIRMRSANSFVSIHLLYHATLMKLNRHARFQSFPTAIVNQYIHRARHHAVEILRISAALIHYISEYESLRPATEPASINPYLGYTIVSAVDALSAIGLMADMPDCINLIKSGLDTVRELGRFWDSSLFLVSLIETRMGAMVESLHCRTGLEGKVAFTVDGQSMDSQVSTCMLKDQPPGPLSEDLLYGQFPPERLFSVLGLDDPSFSEKHILRIQCSN